MATRICVGLLFSVLAGGRSDVALRGALSRTAPGDYTLRIDDIRLFGTPR